MWATPSAPRPPVIFCLLRALILPQSAVCSSQSPFYIDRIWTVPSATDLLYLIPWQLKTLLTPSKLLYSPLDSGNGSWLPQEGLRNYYFLNKKMTSSRMWFPAGLLLVKGSANIFPESDSITGTRKRKSKFKFLFSISYENERLKINMTIEICRPKL